MGRRTGDRQDQAGPYPRIDKRHRELRGTIRPSRYLVAIVMVAATVATLGTAAAVGAISGDGTHSNSLASRASASSPVSLEPSPVTYSNARTAVGQAPSRRLASSLQTTRVEPSAAAVASSAAAIPSVSRTYPAKAQTSAPELAPLPVDTELTGAAAVVWANASLAALRAPTTAVNVRTMVDWFANEGAPHDLNNPLNLQTPYGGSVVSTAGGSPAKYRIQAYSTPADFVAAFSLEMNDGSYPAIVAALKAGTGLEGSASAEIAHELSVYSGGGYDSIPAAYNKK